MKTKQVIAAAALALLGAASFAQDITPDHFNEAVSLKTRDQVKAELAAARADGRLDAWSQRGYIEPSYSVKSREQVRNELAIARMNGELAAINSDAPSIHRTPATMTAGRPATAR